MKILTALLFILSVSPVPGFACPSRNPTIDGAPFSTAGFEGKKLGYSEKFNTFTVKLVERVKDRDGCHSANIYEIYNANGQLISAISESTYIRKDESGTCRFVPPPSFAQHFHNRTRPLWR